MVFRRLRAIALLAALGAIAVALLMVGLFAVDAVLSGIPLTASMLLRVALLFGLIGAVAGVVLALAMMAFARADSLDNARRGRVAAAGGTTGLIILVVMLGLEGGFVDPVGVLNWRVAVWTAVFVTGGAGAATALLAVARRARLPAPAHLPDDPEPTRLE